MSKIIGIDIGTTTICACVYDLEKKKTIEKWTRVHEFIKGSYEWEKIQDAKEIVGIVESIINEAKIKYKDLASIGLTGQMHGIVYFSEDGEAVSPLITWQDERGSVRVSETLETYSEQLERITGYPCATGYGCVTHYYNTINGMIPEKAIGFCTIQDFIFMKLNNKVLNITHASDGASIGLFNMKKKDFDREAIAKAGMNPEMFPKVKDNVCGKTKDNIPVAIPIGDNQASFFGAVKEPEKSILVNVGTGSQVSVWCKEFKDDNSIEFRPFIDGTYIAVGSALCGGKSYAVLEKLFRQIALLIDKNVSQMYEVMGKLLSEENYSDELRVSTTFCGTREHPDLRGKIENISPDNFTAANLVYGFLDGSADELLDIFEKIQNSISGKKEKLIGSGNGIRFNNAFCKIIENKFNMKLKVPEHLEEAAFGAALFSLYMCIGKSLNEVRSYIN